MKTLFGKVFKSKINDELSYNNYPPEVEYYSFVKGCADKGLRQVVITSEIMISLLKYYFITRRFEITEIEFMVDDEDLSASIKALLQKLNADRAYWGELQKQLEFLNECASIDIKKICIKASSAENSFLMFIQVNGIFGISENVFDIEATELVREIMRYQAI